MHPSSIIKGCWLSIKLGSGAQGKIALIGKGEGKGT